MGATNGVIWYKIIRDGNSLIDKTFYYRNKFINLCLNWLASIEFKRHLGSFTINPLAKFDSDINHRPHSRQVTGARCTEVTARQSWAEYSSRPTTGAEQWSLCWLQCLIRKWSCVNFQFQLHTQIAYKPTYMTYDLCHMLLLIIGTDIKSHQFGDSFFGILAQPFHSPQWLCVCAVIIGASYFGDLFSTWQQVLGHTCHIWYSLGLKSLIHNYLTRAVPVRIICIMTGMFDRKWKGRASVLKHWGFFKRKYFPILITD